MTIDFLDRADDALQFGTGLKNPGMRYLTMRHMGELLNHQHWVQSHGRFGMPLTWERASFRGRFCTAENFAQVTLINCVFTWSDLRCASFAGATLKNVKFENCDVEECDFRGAQLENVSFNNCFDLDKANFAGANLVAPERNDPSARQIFPQKTPLQLG